MDAVTTTEPVRVTTASAEPGDGRTARRDRNRSAVVDALLDLYHEGDLAPSADAIAERAGLSPRSLFRYFDDADDLCRAALDRQSELVGAVVAVAATAADPLEDRIEAIVEQRIALYGAVGLSAVVARLRAPFQPMIAEHLTDARSYLRHQIEKLFRPEFERMTLQERTAALAAIDVLCSFEGYDLLIRDQGFSVEESAEVIRGAIRRQLV